jgi:4'-phosphopantetheinyl transferase
MAFLDSDDLLLHERLSLMHGDVHLWRARLDAPEIVMLDAASLPGDELDRAIEFHRPEDARDFVVGRVILRKLLGGYLGADPFELRFRYGRQGKPELHGPGTEGLAFNVAHSSGSALFAFARGRGIGVDLERERDLAVLDIAGQFFAEDETRALRALPAAAQRRAFFRCWTHKEAYLKAKGLGLSALDSFAVALGPCEPGLLAWNRMHPADVERWSFLEPPVSPGFAAAVALEASGSHGGARVEIRDWDAQHG